MRAAVFTEMDAAIYDAIHSRGTPKRARAKVAGAICA
jgi:hypothetical protein